jgi:hypothetical protein
VTPVTCAIVDERNLEARYLAGQLSDAEAEAFEAHYFGCDRCWGLMQRALEVRAASVPALRSRTRRWRAWWPLAAAAALAAVLLPWRQKAPDDSVRGTPNALELIASVQDHELGVVWRRIPDADIYRVRLYAGDGERLFGQETTDTSTSVSIARLQVPRDSRRVLVQIEALDRLRRPLARSALMPVQLPEIP